jgi:hypothetical protein
MCDSGSICQGLRSIPRGGACARSVECAVGFYCATGGTCAPTGTAVPGEACVTSGDCIEGSFCDTPDTRTCVVPRNTTIFTADGRSFAGPPGTPSDLGDACTRLVDCVLGLSCTEHRCVAP